MSPRLIGFVRPLSLAAALLIQFGTAAADSSGDAQQQARNLLAGPVATAVASVAGTPAPAEARRTADAQQRARELIVGVAPSAVTAAHSARAAAPASRTHGDAQVLAQQLLIGQRSSSSAGS